MDKPLSQERLNASLENLRDVLTNDSNPFKPKYPSDFFSVRAHFLIDILDEVKRLQAIERQLHKVIDRQHIQLDKYETLLNQGADTHE
jgi:hypothetical protein